MNAETPPSSHIPTEGERQYTTSVVLITQDAPRRILLTFHEALGIWVPPGGHQEAGENPVDTGIREVLEETGIDIAEYMPKPTQLNGDIIALPLPQYFFEERIGESGSSPAHYHLDFVYIVFIPFQEPRPHSKKPNQTQWFTIDEAKGILLFDNVRHIIEFLV